MYNQIAAVPIKSSASLLYNNFDVLPSKDETEVLFSIIHKSALWLLNPKAAVDNDLSTYKRVVCKGESIHASSLMMQAKWCTLPQRTLLVVASVKGVQMFEADGSSMIFWQALTSSKSTEADDQYTRGICTASDKNICVGTADGSILAFDVPSKGSGVKVQETLKGHDVAVTDIHSYQDQMVSADESGKIILWKVTGHFEKVKEIQGNGSPCCSIRLWKSFIVGGYGSGHIRIYNVESGKLVTEIAAHARWINAIDIAESCGLLISSSEDSYIRVWNLFDFELLFQQSVGDVQITGVKFLDSNGTSFGVTGYDCGDVIMFEKK